MKRVSARVSLTRRDRDATQHILGEVGALALVLEVALLNWLDLLLLGVLRRSGSRLGLGDGGGLGRSSGRCGLGGGGSRSLGDSSLSSGRRLGDGLGDHSLLRHLGGLLCIGHCEFFGLLKQQGISRKLENGYRVSL